MISKDYVIQSSDGIHARPATALIRLTRKFKSTVSVKKGHALVKLNSMLNILALGAKGGESITIVVEGEDETDAADAINHFFETDLEKL